MTSGSRPDAYADLHLAGVPEINTLLARGADPGGRAGASPPDPPGVYEPKTNMNDAGEER
jgi:hypothetical protein